MAKTKREFIDSIIKTEWLKIKNIKLADELWIIYKKWKDVKNIIDAIWEQIDPLEEYRDMVLKLPKGHPDYKIYIRQKAIIDKQVKFLNENYRRDNAKLNPEKFSKFFKKTLQHLYTIGLITYKKLDYNENNSRSSVSHFLKGNVLISNRAKLEQYWKEINDFCEYIEKIYLKKFPGKIGPRQENISSPKKLLDCNGLALYDDGMVRFNNKIIELEPMLKEMCILFIQNFNRLVTLDMIKDSIINADDRPDYNDENIGKYVSKLQKSLRFHIKKRVINSKYKQGWIMVW